MFKDKLSKRTLNLLQHVERRKSKGYCDDMSYPSETAKIRDIAKRYIKETDKVLDIGCGNDLIVPWAEGVDSRPLPTVKHVTDDITTVWLNKTPPVYDVVFSSHYLEHVIDPGRALRAVHFLLKFGGITFLYLPDCRYYDNASNTEHLHSFEYDVFVRWFKAKFKNMGEVIDHGLDIGEDRYSFWLCAKRI